MAGFLRGHGCYANHELDAPTVTDCANADEYYKIGGVWVDGSCQDFIIDGTGRLIYTGQPKHFEFNGASDLSVNKACRIHYALYKDGVAVPKAETPHDFAASSKIGHIGITKIVKDLPACYLEIWVKSDVDNTLVTHSTLMTTFDEVGR